MVRQLHVVAVSEDGRHVLLAGKRGAATGGYRVALDERLVAAVRGDLPRPGEDPQAAPDLSPKQIQARLRAGESAESIARSAGVPVTRVERFAGPVQGEMARMIEATREAFLVRGRIGRSPVPLGVAVDHALDQMPSLRPDSVDWQTRREEDGRWLVTVSWFARARTRTASWHYHAPTRTVTATDPAAALLAHYDPDASVPAPKRKAAPRPAAKPAAKSPAKPAAKSPAKPAAKSPAKPAAKSAAKPAPAVKPTKRAAKPAPAAKPATRARTTAPTPPPARKAPTRATRTLRVVPDPEPRRTPRRSPAERDGVKARATVPGWADVLLGTSPGGER